MIQSEKSAVVGLHHLDCRLWPLPTPKKMNGWISSTVCLSIILSLQLSSAFARRSQDLRCGVCRALVDELEWEISQVDPKKTIQIGSFRINPDGSQSIVEVPYARSEAHLTELLERICENMSDYGEKVDATTHRKNYVRVISHDGTKMDLSETKIDGDVTSSLKFAIALHPKTKRGKNNMIMADEEV
ncbi:protein canopy homolog 2 isoform X2 [Varanus komodoensis]|uniref:protein canopy homolog 2 isoform X2 n=1 Tax=Varanus komodoensis TaxID=61221 RepID=UPI001CF7B3EA|nr:protein canopy homolog 2 isoform X2 [Varanus komodoensis]